MKKLLALLMAVIMLLSFAACGGSSDDDDEDGGSSGSGKTGSVDSAVKIAEEIMNGNVKNLKKLSPASVWDAREEEAGDEFDELYKDYEDDYKRQAEYIKEEYGEDTEVKLSVEDKEDVSSDFLDRIKESLTDTYDIDPDDIKSGCSFTMITSYKNTDEDAEDEEDDMYAVQIGSSWYIIEVYEYDDEFYADFIA